MKLGVAHPMYWTHQVSSEHVHAWARGGTNDPSNLVAVCSQCQYAKNSRSLETLGWELLSARTDAPTWHGLTDKMSALKAAAASVAPPAAASTAAVPLLAGPSMAISEHFGAVSATARAAAELRGQWAAAKGMTVVDQDQTRRYTAPGAKKACLWLYPNPGTERLLLDVGRLVADTAVPDELHNAVKILPGVDRARRPFPSPSWARWSLSACLWCSGGC